MAAVAPQGRAGGERAVVAWAAEAQGRLANLQLAAAGAGAAAVGEWATSGRWCPHTDAKSLL